MIVAVDYFKSFFLRKTKERQIGIFAFYSKVFEKIITIKLLQLVKDGVRNFILRKILKFYFTLSDMRRCKKKG